MVRRRIPCTVASSFREIRGVEVGTRGAHPGYRRRRGRGIAPPGSPVVPVVLRMALKGEYRHLVRNHRQISAKA